MRLWILDSWALVASVSSFTSASSFPFSLSIEALALSKLAFFYSYSVVRSAHWDLSPLTWFIYGLTLSSTALMRSVISFTTLEYSSSVAFLAISYSALTSDTVCSSSLVCWYPAIPRCFSISESASVRFAVRDLRIFSVLSRIASSLRISLS